MHKAHRSKKSRKKQAVAPDLPAPLNRPQQVQLIALANVLEWIAGQLRSLAGSGSNQS